MANTHGTLTELFTAIANAIRTKTGSNAKIVADDFPNAIAGISTGTGTTTPKLQTKTVTPKASNQTVSPDNGYDGLSTVTVSGDSDLVAGNIKNGVNIFGVTGSYTGSGGSGGTTLPDLENPASATDIAEGLEAWINGEKVTGTVKAYDKQVGWTVSPEEVEGYVDLKIDTNIPYLFRKGVYMRSALSNFGNANPEDVTAGKTFTSKSGLLVRGTNTGSAGMVMKTGSVNLDATAEKLIIETGLSSVNCIFISHAQPSVSATWGWDMSFDGNVGKVLYRSVSQYSSFNYGADTANKVTANGGTITAEQHSSSYPVDSGKFTWVAYGYE